MHKAMRMALAVVALGGSALADESADYSIRAAGVTDVRVTGGFWLPRVETNRLVTLKTDFAKCNETPRIANFTNAANRTIGTFGGIPFDDSDVFKVMEGAAYVYAQSKDPELKKYMDWFIGEVAKAQEPDGYLYTARTLGHYAVHCKDKDRPWHTSMMGPTRWSNLGSSHELYNQGHMIEAAVAWFEATGERNFLEVATKSADMMCRTFGPDKTKLKLTSGHQEIELALCKLYRVTKDRKYLDLAKFFLDMRGRKDIRETWGAAMQDHLPVCEQPEAVGHAVRAGYMYSGMADVAALTGEKSYVMAINGLWENVVGRKMSLNGGIGTRSEMEHREFGHLGETFSYDYDITNDFPWTYNETCATIANVLWNQRMFLTHGETKYVDVMELAIYNGFLSGISLSGDEFFYPNPLACKGGYKRSKWFGCSCCPVNDVRFIPQIPTFAYATDGKGTLYWNLFIEGEATIAGTTFKVETAYPWKGQAKLTLLSSPSTFDRQPSTFNFQLSTLKIRLPGWSVGRPVPSDLYVQTAPAAADDIKIAVNGTTVDARPGKDGYVVVARAWKAGDVVTLDLPMPVKRIRAHEKVDADRGRLAVMRGPVLFCAEGVDNGGKAYGLTLPADATFAETMFAIGNETFPMLSTGGAKLVPYCTWGNRQPGNDLQCWFPVRAEGAVAGRPCVKDGERVAFLGDSITEFGNRPVGYVNLVMKGLELLGRTGVVKVPAGISGNKSNQMLARLDRDVLSKRPQWMTLSCGVNDVWHGKGGVPLEQYKANISKILDTCAASNVNVIVLTPTLIGEDEKNENNQKLLGYVAWLKEEAARRRLPVADLNAAMRAELKRIRETDKRSGNKLTVDGVHMADAGNRLMAWGVLEAMGVKASEKPRLDAAWTEMIAADRPKPRVELAVPRLAAKPTLDGVDAFRKAAARPRPLSGVASMLTKPGKMDFAFAHDGENLYLLIEDSEPADVKAFRAAKPSKGFDWSTPVEIYLDGDQAPKGYYFFSYMYNGNRFTGFGAKELPPDRVKWTVEQKLVGETLLALVTVPLKDIGVDLAKKPTVGAMLLGGGHTAWNAGNYHTPACFQTLRLSAAAAVPSDERMKGPFLIASTPYLEDGSVDYDALVREAEYMDRSGCCGIIWPQSNDSIDLLTHEEKFTAIRRLAEAAKGFRNAVLTIGVNGTNTAEMLEFVAFAEKVAASSPAPIALASRPPTDGRTVEEMHAYFEALGRAAKRPVIVQSLVNEKCPDPEADYLIDLARRYPGVYGYVKEESDGQRALERQLAEVRAKPTIKTVFSAMGGWMWLYQARQCGTEGLISERPAYAPLVARIWHEMKTGDKRGDLQALYATYRYMIDQRAVPEESLRGYSLHYLKKLGLFKTTLSRTYLKSRETNAGTYGDGHAWKLVDLKLSDRDRAELDANFEGMRRLLASLPPVGKEDRLETSTFVAKHPTKFLPLPTDREKAIAAFEENVYGRRPSLANFKRTAKVIATREVPELKAVRKDILLNTLTPRGETNFLAVCYIPKSERPVPAFVKICLRPVTGLADDPYATELYRKMENPRVPIADVLGRGFAVMMFHHASVFPDNKASMDGIDRPADGWGAISAWALAASRCLDWIETEKAVDASHVAVIGHSRGGKTAIWAGVTDTRFALVISNDSGCSGARMSAVVSKPCEKIADITNVFPYWFAPNYRTRWAGKDTELPFDHHQLLALVAPRLLAVGSAIDDFWACPQGEETSLRFASRAWENPCAVHYHCRDGMHTLTPEDWTQYMDFAAANGWLGAQASTTPAEPDEPGCRCWWFEHFDATKAKAKKEGKDVKIVFLGDSITHLYAKDVWNANYTNEAYRAINFGFCGDRTEHVLWRLQHGQMDNLDPKAIVLLIGTNNTWHRTIDREKPEDTVCGIRLIVDTLLARCPNAKIILHPIFPIGADDKDERRVRNAIVNQALPGLCDGRRVFWCDFNRKLLEPDGVTLSKEVAPDLVHPSAKGYRIWAENLKPTLDDVLGYANASVADLVGSWGITIPEGMDKVPEKVAHLIVTRNEKGELEGSLLWRWGSPEKVLSIDVDGNRFSIVHPWAFKFEGVLDGDWMLGRAVSLDPKQSIGRVGGGIVGRRNPSVPDANVKDAKFGEPIDLLKNGKADWETLPGNGEDRWSFKDGVLSNRVKKNAKGEWAGGGLNLVTKRRDFTDFKLAYDVRVPKNANSGVYLRGRYEIQTLDSYGQKPDLHSMCAYYGRVAPRVAAEKPAGEWQHVEATLYKYHLTVVLNGVTIIDNAPITGLTGGALDADEAAPGPIYVQGDHSDADYRNMRLFPVL